MFYLDLHKEFSEADYRRKFYPCMRKKGGFCGSLWRRRHCDGGSNPTPRTFQHCYGWTPVVGCYFGFPKIFASSM